MYFMYNYTIFLYYFLNICVRARHNQILKRSRAEKVKLSGILKLFSVKFDFLRVLCYNKNTKLKGEISGCKWRLNTGVVFGSTKNEIAACRGKAK